MKNIIDVYKSVLETAGLYADEDGFVSVQLAKTEKKPALVKGKRLILPTDAQLRVPDLSNRMAFNPLSESILRGESEVVTYFRETFIKRLNFIVGYSAISLLDLAVSTAEHPKLSPEQTAFLLKVREADEETVRRIQKITEAMMLGDSSRAFVHIRVQKNGTVKNAMHRRVGIVYFPFYEEIKRVPAPKEPNEIYGVKLRKADRETFTALMEYIFPRIDEPDQWMFPSDSEIAPSFEALMKSIIAVGDPVNTLIDMFKDYIAGSEDLYINGDWEEDFRDLNALLPQIRMIPMLPGNEGRAAPQGQNVISVNSPAPTAQAAPAAPVAAPARQTTGDPNAAVKRPVGGLASMALSDIGTSDERPQMPPQPMVQQPASMPYQPQPMVAPYQQNPYQAQMQSQMQQQFQQPMGYPNQMQQQMPNQGIAPGSLVTVQTPQGPMQMMMGPNGQLMPPQQLGQPQFQQQPAQIQKTERGLDFNSVLRANPAMMQNFAPQQPQYGQQVQGGAPRWAQPNYTGI